MLSRLTAWARAIRRDTIALWFAAKDPRTPVWVKAYLWLVVAYALSPIDLIPDVIPILGYLDEALLLPLAIWLAVKVIPALVLADARTRALTLERKPRLIAGAWLIGLIWLAALAWLVRVLWAD